MKHERTHSLTNFIILPLESNMHCNFYGAYRAYKNSIDGNYI